MPKTTRGVGRTVTGAGAVRANRRRRRGKKRDSVSVEDDSLSAAQKRELMRRMDDSLDRKRYILATVLADRFVLFYNVSEDTYCWDDPDDATLFKRRRAALAMRGLLDGNVKVVPCRVDARGRLIAKSVAVR
jgi:hypothetical protein